MLGGRKKTLSVFEPYKPLRANLTLHSPFTSPAKDYQFVRKNRIALSFKRRHLKEDMGLMLKIDNKYFYYVENGDILEIMRVSELSTIKIFRNSGRIEEPFDRWTYDHAFVKKGVCHEL